MVKVLSAPTDANISFIATQYGAEIMPTNCAEMNTENYTFQGECGQGNINGDYYSFTNYGSYSGKKLDKNMNVFYFASNMFVNSHNLSASKPYVYVYPFRSYYEYEDNNVGSKMLKSFAASYDIPSESAIGETTGIQEVSQKPSLAVTTGQGTISFAAATDSQVKVVGINGTNAARVSVKAGETATIQVPAGIYVVNGVKVIVK